jgi:hypothetical protein
MAHPFDRLFTPQHKLGGSAARGRQMAPPPPPSGPSQIFRDTK